LQILYLHQHLFRLFAVPAFYFGAASICLPQPLTNFHFIKLLKGRRPQAAFSFVIKKQPPH
jgi:hypothetical protein